MRLTAMPSRSSVAETLAADLARRAFGAPAGIGRRLIGAEAELIAVASDSGAPIPIEAEMGPSTLPVLRRHAVRAGWVEIAWPGAPAFRTPDGGTVAYEPGGQIEHSTPPLGTVAELVACLQRTMAPLHEAAAAEGISLLGVGLDPINPLEAVPLQLRSPRYAAMDEYFSRIGDAGARMMRQTASLQVSLDWDDDVAEQWRMLNAVAPYLTALFASSSQYAGAATGDRSHRARLWQRLDPLRTGLFAGGPDPVPEYLAFALRAPTILKRSPAGEPLPFQDWISAGEVGSDDWRLHLSTLFPEVRPKGFAEVRSIDALEPEWYAAPIVLLVGLTYDRTARAEALDLLGPPTPGLLGQAASVGLRDPHIASHARDLFLIGLAGAAAIGPPLCDHSVVEQARAFFDRYTRFGRSPADDREDPPLEPALAAG